MRSSSTNSALRSSKCFLFITVFYLPLALSNTHSTHHPLICKIKLKSNRSVSRFNKKRWLIYLNKLQLVLSLACYCSIGRFLIAASKPKPYSKYIANHNKWKERNEPIRNRSKNMQLVRKCLVVVVIVNLVQLHFRAVFNWFSEVCVW